MVKVVTIGGGTGSFITLRGLKKHPFDITAVVNTFDSGGSSGVLRDEYGVLPPGDIRRCLVALSDDEAEPHLRALFNHRFSKGVLRDHNFGNILITALAQIEHNYADAVNAAAKILSCRGHICPVSLTESHLCAELEDGTIVQGETNIDIPKHDPFLKIKRVFLDPPVGIHDAARQAIVEADIIIIGPGDLYTSLVPNLLVAGVPEALQQSRAKKVYVCNLMTKLGETHGFTASHFMKELLQYSGLQKFDYALYNTVPIPDSVLKRYAVENKYPVMLDADTKKYVDTIIATDIFSQADVLRHDSDKIADVIRSII